MSKMAKILIAGVVAATIIGIIIAVSVTTTQGQGTQDDSKQQVQQQLPEQLGENGLRGIVVFNVGNDRSGVMGTLELTQEDENTPVRIRGKISGLPPNTVHGFHVHESGDIRQGCKSTGGHFNPKKVEHGSPMDSMRHIGDLGNIKADDKGEADLNIEDSHISLRGPNSIAGRAFVIHENEDDLGQGGHPDSKKTGNAGGRISCGIIGVIYPTR